MDQIEKLRKKQNKIRVAQFKKQLIGSVAQLRVKLTHLERMTLLREVLITFLG